MSKPETMEEYSAAFPANTQVKLEQVYEAIKGAVPDATEVISYGIPTFRLNGKNLLHYGAFSEHIGLYATPDGHADFESELSNYKQGKGSVQFPLSQPIPHDLIRRIALYRAEQLRP